MKSSITGSPDTPSGTNHYEKFTLRTEYRYTFNSNMVKYLVLDGFLETHHLCKSCSIRHPNIGWSAGPADILLLPSV